MDWYPAELHASVASGVQHGFGAASCYLQEHIVRKCKEVSSAKLKG